MSNREERLARKRERRLTLATLQAFSGPLPPPNLLAQYNDVVEGGAERIMAMAEKQAQHRQELERKVVYSNTTDQRLGLILGFIVMMFIASIGIYLSLHGKDISGVAALISSAAMPVVAFIYGRKRQEKERSDKR